MTKAEMLTLFEYNAWAHARVFDAVAALTPERFTRDLKNSFPSIRDTLVHILSAEWLWLRRWHGESLTTGLSAADFPTLDDVRARAASLEQERQAFLGPLPEARLAQPFRYRDLQGVERSLRLVESCQHVVNHGTYHRGQVTTMLRQLGASAVSTDLSRFHLEQGPHG